MTDGLMVRVGAERTEERLLARELAAAVAAGSPTTRPTPCASVRGTSARSAAEPGGRPADRRGARADRPAPVGRAEEEPVRILASKPLRQTSAYVTKGLLLTFTAKPDHEPEVEAILMDAQPMAAAEEGTAAWYALRMANGDYGIFDVFPNRRSRLRHITGEHPAAAGQARRRAWSAPCRGRTCSTWWRPRRAGRARHRPSVTGRRR